MSFLSREQLMNMGFRSLGRNVLISEKASIYGADRMAIGDNVRIDDFTVLSGAITILRNVHVSVFCNVSAGSTGVTFDDFSGLAAGCHVFAESDDYTGQSLTNPTVPEAYRLVTRKPVHIGRHCIVGSGSRVFPGVTLGEGCSVGAMSKVTRSTEPWSIYAGTPARRIRERERTLLQREQEYLEADAAARPDRPEDGS